MRCSRATGFQRDASRTRGARFTLAVEPQASERGAGNSWRERAAGGNAQIATVATDVLKVRRAVHPREQIVGPGGLHGAATRDFLAGMTDRFAVTLYERLFIPKPWIGPMAWDQL